MSTGTPFSDTIWSEREIWSRDQTAAFQLEALKQQMAYVGGNSAYYQGIFKQAGFDPRGIKSLDDLRQLPLTRKRDYVAAIPSDLPWGPFLACDPKDIRRVHFSSGTTGKPAHMCWTEADVDRWADLFARYFYAMGIRKGDVMQLMVGFAWFVGGLGLANAALRLGATLIPAGNGDSQRQITTLMDFGVTSAFATSSFAAHLAEVAAEMGVDLRKSPLKRMLVGGEPGGGIAATRRRIEDAWGADTYDCYGMIEFQPAAWETEAKDGLVLAEDFVFAEVLDPATDQPVEDGTPGVLVLTHLDKQACPLVRWWTGDIVVRDSRPSSDGRTFARLIGGVQGRADDMLVIRGVNVFPSSIEQVIRSIPGVGMEYQIILDDSLLDAAGFLTGIKLRAEIESGDSAALAKAVADAVREKLTIRANVELVPAGGLPRAMHKAQRIVKAFGG